MKCKKLCTLIKTVAGRNIKSPLKIEYYHVRTEYGEIINATETSNGDDAIADVWNEYNPKKVTDKKSNKHQNGLLNNDDRNLSTSRNLSRNFK